MKYTILSAMNEFIDNSTASFQAHKAELTKINGGNATLQINITYNRAAGELEILDNAYGMNRQEFERSIKLNAKPPDRTGRNEFGMGLKMAASWLAREWKVVTKQPYGHEYRAVVDTDEMQRSDPQSIIGSSIDLTDEKRSYTHIILTGLLKNISNTARTRIIKDLGSTYRRDIANGDVSIFWDEIKAEYEPATWAVLPTGDARQVFDLKITGDDLEPNVVRTAQVDAFVLGSHNGIKGDAAKAGIHIFRKNRLIRGGLNKGWKPAAIYANAGSYERQRLYIEIDMDEWDPTQTKDDINWAQDDFDGNFVEELNSQVSELRAMADTRNKPKGQNDEFSITITDATNAGDAIKDDFSNADMDIALIQGQEAENTALTLADHNAQHQLMLDSSEAEPVEVLYGTNESPKVLIYYDVEAHPTALYMTVSNNQDEVELVVNLNHPFVAEHIGTNQQGLTIFHRMVMADVAVDWLMKGNVKISPVHYRSIKDKILRSIRPTIRGNT